MSTPVARSWRSFRTFLFVPADRPERIAKAQAAGADAVIVDLEDAVAPEAKAAARDALAHWLSQWQPDQSTVVLRVNGADTPWFDDDLRLAAHPGIASVMLPKAARVEEIAAVQGLPAAPPVLALVESAAGLAAARTLAATPGVARLVFGTVDFQLDLDLDEGAAPEALRAYGAELVLASRLGGLPAPVDGVSLVLDDETRLAAEAARSRALGFGGKLCIHPRQVGVVAAAWQASPAQQDWARRVLAAHAESGGRGAFSLDGKMVDAPVLARARRLLQG